MAGFMVMVFVVVGFIVVVAARAHSKKVGETWSAVARDLNLMYDPGGGFRGRSMSGRHRENDILVDTFTRSSGKSSTTYTRYRIRYPRPLGLGLKLSREGFFSGVSKVFGAQDIQVGDATFDQGVMVKGDDPFRVVRFLTLARRARIHRALMSFSGLKIEDDEIYFERVGLESAGTRLADTVRRLSVLAWFLSGDRREDQALERAAQARLEGRLDDAIAEARQVPTVESVPPIEARLMEAHMLHLGNRNEEARRILDDAARDAPEDAEVQAWTRLRDAAPPPLPDTPEPEPETLPTQEAAPPESSPEPATGPTIEAFCSAVFKPNGTSADVDAAFSSSFAGQRVRWSGVLRTYQSTSFDFVFGSRPCTKATLEVHELSGGLMGGKQIQAIVQFPPEAKDTLQDRSGEEVTFTAELLKVDGLMRNVYLRDGLME